MVPNSVVLSVAVVPLREPEGVDLRARLPRRRHAERRPGAAAGERPDADARRRRGSCSRSSTATRSSCASRRRRRRPSDGPKLAVRGARGRRAGRSRRPAARRRRLRAELALAGLTGAELCRDLLAAEPALQARGQRRARPSRSASRASCPAGPRRPRRGRARSPRSTRVGDLLRRARADEARAASTPESANIPASRMKPGKTTLTPTPGAVQVAAQALPEAAQAELRRAVDARPGGCWSCPASDEMKTRWPHSLGDHRLRQVSREDHRRAQVHLQRAVDLLVGVLQQRARARHARRWRRGGRRGRPRRAAGRPRRAARDRRRSSARRAPARAARARRCGGP